MGTMKHWNAGRLLAATMVLGCGVALHAQTPTQSAASPAAQKPVTSATQTTPTQTTATQTTATPESSNSLQPVRVPDTGSDDGQLQQRPGTGPSAPEFTLPVYVNEVNLIFTVVDKKGHFVTGLTADKFALLDDGKPYARFVRFQQQTDLPLRVGIMLDTSSSIRQRFTFEQQAATDFLLQVLHQSDYAFVEGFDVQTELTQDFTNRIDLLDTGIQRLRPAGGTSLFDALYKTCRDQMLTLKGAGSVRKTLVLVSDGDDNYSHVLKSEAIKMCQRAATSVNTISTNSGPSRDVGDDVLQELADNTGGIAIFPRRIEDVSTGFEAIEEALRSQYSLVYQPSDFKQDGSFRKIYLESRVPGYTVRAEKGYFAPKALR
jgi:VWFA-related protein